MNSFVNKTPGILLLEHGAIFEGYILGASQLSVGELVFHTAMTGYQEIITDPSYAHQMVAFSYPHIGNVGINAEDFESKKIWASGIVVYEACAFPSHHQQKKTLHEYLLQENTVGISSIDTRKLVAHIRDNGAEKACIVPEGFSVDQALQAMAQFEGLSGVDLAKEVTCDGVYELHPQKSAQKHVLVYDFGVKQTILERLLEKDCRLTVVPANYAVADVLALKPDGILLSNGPGDPNACSYAIANIKALLEYQIPIFGICLGHQLLALAGGCKTFKMKMGHHGANHPVHNLLKNTVCVTSQNHGFAVDSVLPDGIDLTFVSLFDNTVQGIQFREKPFFGFQGHPEAGPGPTDASFLFDQFIDFMNGEFYA